MNHEPNPFYAKMRLLADLHWALRAPSLAHSGFDVERYTESHGLTAYRSPFQRSISFMSLGERYSWLDYNETEISVLREALHDRIRLSLIRHKNRTLRLGIYFEELLDVWLKSRDGVTVEASHLAITEESSGRTLGELDWVLQSNGSDVREHWECALKFYIAASRATHLGAFRGPNLDDHMARKLNHMIFQQLPLSLLRYQSPMPFCSMVGVLFFRWKPGSPMWTTVEECAALRPDITSARLPWLNPRAHARSWVPEADVGAFVESYKSSPDQSSQDPLSLVALPKCLWMSPLQSEEWDFLKSAPGHGPPPTGPSFVALVRHTPNYYYINEITRFFIIPNQTAEQYEDN